MEDFIQNFFEIKKIKVLEYLPSVKIYFKNNNNEYFFDVKDYQTDTNFYDVQIGNLENKFHQNDSISIKYITENNIEIYCLDPFHTQEINKNHYSDIGILKLENNTNYIILKLISNNINYIILISFIPSVKNIIISEKLPIEIQLFLKDNIETDCFFNNFSKNLSNIIDLPEENIILIDTNKNILRQCNFILIPDKETKRSSLAFNKILHLYTISKTHEKCQNKSFFKIESKYDFIIKNVIHIKNINVYSDKNLLYGLQIKSNNYNHYESNINMSYPQIKNKISIDNFGKYTNILFQLKNKDYQINYFTDNEDFIMKDNYVTIISSNCFIDIEIVKEVKNIILPICCDNIKVNEINKFRLYLEYKKDNDYKSKNNLILEKLDINKLKIISISTLLGIIGGFTYSKIFNNKDNDETFIPEYTNVNIDNKIINKEILNSKYKKICDKDIEIINNLNIFKNKKIKNY